MAGMLFIGGCQRSGTTAFADYLNEHDEILVCRERYKWLPQREVTPAIFTRERLLNYCHDARNKHGGWETNIPRRYHEELLAGKDLHNLRWIGDKNPDYVKDLKRLSHNNPGAKFIMLYRPVEEVAASWEARSNNPEDRWLGGKNGLELGVNAWNEALRSLHRFARYRPEAEVLIIGYHDFFHGDGSCLTLLSEFLEIEFGEEISRRWEGITGSFEARRKDRLQLSPEQMNYIRRRKNDDLERWVLGRIERQHGVV